MSTTLRTARPGQALAPPWAAALDLRALPLAVLLLCSLAGELGLAWDVQWHRSVGRDAFLTPPHALLYASTGVAGLVCLGVVLWRTQLARQTPRASAQAEQSDDEVTVFGVFRAPLGIVVAGFGALTTALAAPLDNYWHELYGVDVALWAPFHLMGLLGGIIRDFGLLYLAASLVVRAPRSRAAHAAVLLAGAFQVATFLNVVQPGQVLYPTLHVGPLEVMDYPVLLALLVPGMLLAVRGGDRRAWSASGLAICNLALGLGLAVYVPWAVRTGVVLEGLSYRTASSAPSFSPLGLLPEVAVLLVALLADRFDGRWRPALLGGLLGLALWLLGAGIGQLEGTSTAIALANGLEIPPGVQVPPPASLAAILLALPVATLGGALSAAVGHGLGEILRRNPR